MTLLFPDNILTTQRKFIGVYTPAIREAESPQPRSMSVRSGAPPTSWDHHLYSPLAYATENMQATQPFTVVITGGTGSFGQAFTAYLLENTPHHVRIFSRDEHKQEEMWSSCPPSARLTYILGDVRDRDRLETAFDSADVVIHAAALKIVRTGEIHSDEVMKTNIVGTANVVMAALTTGVRRSLLISSDKAVSPINDYGVSKAQAERLFIHGNAEGVSRGCTFSVVRGGNVWGSRGSVVETWREAVARGQALAVNSEVATRFHMTMPFWTEFVYNVIGMMRGGEIFIPRVRAWRLIDLAFAFGNPHGIVMNALRNGDKPHEALFNEQEAERVRTKGGMFILEPPDELRAVWNYQPWTWPAWAWEGTAGGAYTSDAVERVGIDELRSLVNGN